MEITRVFTGDDGQSHFETINVALSASRYGSLSERYGAEGVIFRETPAGGELDFHNAPRRQFVVTLSGVVEIEIGDGGKQRLSAGDILLADDVTGAGAHHARNRSAAPQPVHPAARRFRCGQPARLAQLKPFPDGGS